MTLWNLNLAPMHLSKARPAGRLGFTDCRFTNCRFTDCRLVLGFLAACLVCIAATAAKAENRLAADLFSEIKMTDTVSSAATRTADNASPRPAVRSTVLGSISLAKILTDNGIAADVVRESVQVNLDDWLADDGSAADTPQAPAKQESVASTTLRLKVDAEASRIDLFLPIRSIDPSSPPSGPTWIQLMQELSRHNHIHLAMPDRTFALQASVGNQDVTAQQLRSAAQRLRIAAVACQATLAKANPSTSNQAQVTNAGQVTSTKPSQASPDARVENASGSKNAASNGANSNTSGSLPIAGTWSAKTSSSDAWAIRLTAEGQFVMVHTRSGKNSVSRGTYQLNAGQLKLVETGGLTLSGKINRTSTEQFTWTLVDKQGNRLTALNFKKQG